MEPLLEAASLGVPLTLTIETKRVPGAYAWPAAPGAARPAAWHEALATATFGW